MASRAVVRPPARRGGGLRSSILGEWRKGKVRPIPGNAPRNRLVSRGIWMLWSICDDPFSATGFPQLLRTIPGARYAFSKAWRNLSGPMGFKNTKPKPKPKPKPEPGPCRLPLVGPGPRSKNAPGGSRSFSSSADEFRPAIPRSGCSPAEPVSASPAARA